MFVTVEGGPRSAQRNAPAPAVRRTASLGPPMPRAASSPVRSSSTRASNPASPRSYSPVRSATPRSPSSIRPASPRSPSPVRSESPRSPSLESSRGRTEGLWGFSGRDRSESPLPPYSPRDPMAPPPYLRREKSGLFEVYSPPRYSAIVRSSRFRGRGNLPGPIDTQRPIIAERVVESPTSMNAPQLP